MGWRGSVLGQLRRGRRGLHVGRGGVGLRALYPDSFIVLISSGSLFLGTPLWPLTSEETEEVFPRPAWKALWFQICQVIRITWGRC